MKKNLYLSLLAFPVVDEQNDSVTYGHLTDGVYGGSEEHLQLPVHEGGAELLVLLIGYHDGGTALVAVVSQTEARHRIPVGGEDGAEAFFGGTDEHEIMEEAAHIVSGVGAHKLEGDEEIEVFSPGRGLRELSIQQLSLLLAMEHGLYPLWAEMYHHIPHPFCVLDCLSLFVHIYFLSLSARVFSGGAVFVLNA